MTLGCVHVQCYNNNSNNNNNNTRLYYRQHDHPTSSLQPSRPPIIPQAAKWCTDASEDVHLMDTSMKNLWDSLDEAAEVVSCPKINGLYRSAVWDQLCAELPGWLIALLVSCMVLSTLLLLLVSLHPS